MIRIDSVTKRFGRATAVDNVSLDIPAGDSVALWGVNGAGKTTLIRCVLGLYRFSGRIEVGGHDVGRRGKRARALIGYVPQELGFHDELGVAEAVRYFALLRGLRVRSAESVLDDVGLAGHGGKRVRELSGGMKQRLALAIAMLGNPPVLVLDEVTASLDACGRGEFVGLLSRLSGAGRTILFASHRIEEVTTLARRVVVLEAGRIGAQTDSETFAESLGLHSMLHLTIRESTRRLALEHLCASGFAARMNGVGLLVPVAREQKAAPFRVLAEARIAIDDFELIAADAAGAPAHTQEAQP
ncbi:MAG: ABC transporter ATP-binding protein [Phycisphaeraceae bacterium]|nr:ABC transporter ATP-binding protein [Phycisphaeraceae bacterium]